MRRTGGRPRAAAWIAAAWVMLAAQMALGQSGSREADRRREAGLAAMQQGQYAQAITELSRAIELTPRDARALASRGECYVLTGANDEAIADLTRSLEISPGNGRALARRGEAYRARAQYDLAIRDLDQAIAMDAGDSYAFASRGDAYRLAGDCKRAVDDLSRAIDLSPGYQWALARRGEAYRVLARNDLALLDLSEAVSLAPGDSFAYASRGQVNRQNGHYAEALADFDRAIQIDPNYSWAIERRRETVAEMAPPSAAGTGPAVSPAAVGPLPLVAVLDFRIESLPPADGQLIVDLLTSALVQTRRYRVLERSQRESLLKEIEFSHSDMADERRQLEIGRMLSADQIVVGSLGRVGQRFVINAKLLDVRTGEALGSAYKVHKSLEEVVDACGELAASLGH